MRQKLYEILMVLTDLNYLFFQAHFSELHFLQNYLIQRYGMKRFEPFSIIHDNVSYNPMHLVYLYFLFIL